MSGVDEQPNERVKEYFINALTELEVVIEPVELERIWDLIKSKYAGRPYHNLKHIEYMLDMCRSVMEGGIDYGTADVWSNSMRDIAIIFHDVEMGENAEERSLALCLQELGQYLEDYPKYQITRCILATDHENYTPEDNSEAEYHAQFVKDCDLAILGDTIEPYAEYQVNIMVEYLGEDINDPAKQDEYYRGRINFLKKMLAQPMIYYMRPFGLKYEWYARENMLQEIEMHNMILNRRNEE